MSRRMWPALLAAVVAIVVAGCGDDDDESSGSGESAETSAQTEASAKPSGPPIKLGFICSCDGPSSAAAKASIDVIGAWEKWTNDNGGINGHPVEVVKYNDEGDAAKSGKYVRQLVEQDKVIAIIGQASYLDSTWADYVASKNIPVIGGSNFNAPQQGTNPMFFTTAGQVVPMMYGLLTAAKDAFGSQKVGTIVCAEVSACAQFAQLIAAVAPVAGVDLVYSGKAGATQPNYTALCLAAKDSGAETMFYATSGEVTLRIADQCVKQGYDPHLLGFQGTLGIRTAEDDPNFQEDFQEVMGALPVVDTSVPGGKLFNEVLDQYLPDLKEDKDFNSQHIGVFAGGQAFAKAAEAAKVGPDSTSADVLKGLYQFKGETLDGITPPLTYAKGKPTSVTCYFYAEMRDQEYTSTGSEPTCVPPDKLKELYAAVGG